MLQPLLVFSDWGILFLRVMFALVLIAHGVNKLKNFKSTAEWMGNVAKPGKFWATLVTANEVGGGLLLLAGFFTQIICIITMLQFLFIIFRVNWKKGLVGGYELDLMMLATAFALLTLGPGAYSLDKHFGITLWW